MLPVIGHSLTIYVINQLYGKVANWCTDLENHRLDIGKIFHSGHYICFLVGMFIVGTTHW